MEAKYKDGEIVIERVRPGSKMIVIRRQDGLYYCKTIGGRARKPLAYLERDLKEFSIL